MGVTQDVLVAIVQGTTRRQAIAAVIGREIHAVEAAVQKLKRRELVVSEAPGVYAPTGAGLEWVGSGKEITSGQTQNASRPRQRTNGLRQRAWWVLRARGTVTIHDLLSTLADGTEKDAESNLRRYLRSLELAGFLTALPHKLPGTTKGSTGYKLYRLVRNNGRKAPVVRQTAGAVFDPNTGEVFGMEVTP